MIVEFLPGAPRVAVERIRSLLLTEGCDVTEVLAGRVVILIADRHWPTPPLDLMSQLKANDWISDVRGLDTLLPKVGGSATKPIVVRGVSFGGDDLALIAGPCTVEGYETLLLTAQAVRQSGARFLRGGAFKPTTSPYSHQGGREEALQALAAVRKEVDIGVVTEVMSPAQVDRVAEVADILQIGARNMQNFDLLREVGQLGAPVLLKRGFGATLDEWLNAAEHIAVAGSERIILCERGVRSFDPLLRASLDVSGIAAARTRTHLPVIADPSHAAGVRRFVEPLALAAVAAGAVGLMVEVHPDPESSVKDGAQTLDLDSFARLARLARAIWGAIRGELHADLQ
jgi:3-deoxy-7-phosphoheptulonate synthase